jgi:hypothetical protein
MSSLRIDVTSSGPGLADAFKLAFGILPRASHYAFTDRHGLVFFAADPGSSCPGAVGLPSELSPSRLAEFARRWLAEGEASGWRVYNEEMGLVGDMKGSVLAVQPVRD